ncbi:MAG: CoA transferase, partial [Dehalococcoidia bacterium]
MVAPLSGIRVIEVANWLAAPSAAALMADLGADV